MGLAYDVFGNGRTALKVNFGKYLEGVGVSTNYANSNPTLRIPTSTGAVRRAGRHPRVDRCRRRLRPGLRPQQPREPGPARQRRRPLRAGLERALGSERPDEPVRPESAQGLGRASVGLGLRRLGPAAAPAPDVGRGGLSPPLVRAASPCRTTRWSPTPSTTRSASPRRSTRRCRVAAATSCPASTTSRPAKFGQILNNVTDSSTFGETSQVFNGVDVTAQPASGRPDAPGRHQHRADDGRLL